MKPFCPWFLLLCQASTIACEEVPGTSLIVTVQNEPDIQSFVQSQPPASCTWSAASPTFYELESPQQSILPELDRQLLYPTGVSEEFQCSPCCLTGLAFRKCSVVSESQQKQSHYAAPQKRVMILRTLPLLPRALIDEDDQERGSGATTVASEQQSLHGGRQTVGGML